MVGAAERPGQLIEMRILDCRHDTHAQAILAILNHAIVHTTALYDYHPRPLSSMQAWFSVRDEQGFPVIGMVCDDGTLAGFASFATFRAWPAFKYSVEHSVYVHPDHRGRGVARALLRELVERARQRGVHVMVGGIDADNHASIALHRALGFEHAGTIREAGYKFGRWLDLAFYQRVLDTPSAPCDG